MHGWSPKSNRHIQYPECASEFFGNAPQPAVFDKQARPTMPPFCAGLARQAKKAELMGGHLSESRRFRLSRSLLRRRWEKGPSHQEIDNRIRNAHR